ncbi:uncharacterized protein LOC118760985 [Octopus sinensis]|uniref:Uncharacterized protein LOC118760985 n=1 Tax=Octopus sinensis TaxID=2607531 RepID=A0A7E6EGP1_9MOLL|nr:uncharacterized protein LOC118760985 [Octopus sinensis]
MVDTHYKFPLQNKVTRTMMDNGKNFVEVFMQFGTEVELLPDILEAAANPDVEGAKDVDLDMDPEAGDVDEVEYISVDASLDESSGLVLNLPVHIKCVSHTFNLVANIDANKALDSTMFKSAYRKAMSKVQQLCNLQSCSMVAADSILDVLKRRLVVSNGTRWNSTYDSVIVLNNLLERNRAAVHRVMTQLKLQAFTNSDVKFLTEYA